MPSSLIVFKKKEIITYEYVRTHAQISCPKHDLQTWHWHGNLNFWVGAYRVLEKRSSYLGCHSLKLDPAYLVSN